MDARKREPKTPFLFHESPASSGVFFLARTIVPPPERGREADVPGAVLELKYRLADETRLPDLVGDLPYRVTRSSKYVNGIRATWR